MPRRSVGHLLKRLDNGQRRADVAARAAPGDEDADGFQALTPFPSPAAGEGSLWPCQPRLRAARGMCAKPGLLPW